MSMWRSNLVLLISLALLALAALSCQGSVSANKQAVIGMTLHRRGADLATIERQFDLMAAMGVSWVRMDIDWAVVETERGQFDWTTPDMIAREAADHGMHVLAVFAFSPAWAGSPATSHSSTTRHSRPGDMGDYARFARIAAKRYASRGVHTWEIWNEPNSDKFWPPRPDATEYGRLFRVAAEAIRSVDSQATLLIGGLAPLPDPPEIGITPAQYLDQLYRDGAAQLADGVAVHPYSFPALPLEPSQQPDGGFKDLAELHNVMEKHGDGQTKIWVTEFGAPTGTGPDAVSDEAQAAILVQARQQIERWDWAGPLIYYELVDGGTDPTDIEQNFGVLRENLTLKVAALALMGTTES
jgi:hypothetical protein